MPDLKLTDADNNRSVEVCINDNIIMNLEENRSTAYMWQDVEKQGKNILVFGSG